MKTLLLSALLLASNAYGQSPVFKTPFSWSEKGHVMIEAKINDRWSLPMAVDTGAAHAVLPEASIEALAITPSQISTVRAMTATDTRRLRRIRLDSIAIEDQSVPNQSALILDLDKLGSSDTFVGVLPFTYLNKFNVLFDFEKLELAFFDRSIPTNQYLTANTFSSVPFISVNGFIRFELEINGISIPAILDTGASGLPLVNWKAANAIGINKDSNKLVMGRDVTGAGKRTVTTSQVAIETLTIGGGTTKTTAVDILDMPHLDQMFGNQPAANVGLSRLGLKALLVDYENQTLHLSFG